MIFSSLCLDTNDPESVSRFGYIHSADRPLTQMGWVHKEAVIQFKLHGEAIAVWKKKYKNREINSNTPSWSSLSETTLRRCVKGIYYMALIAGTTQPEPDYPHLPGRPSQVPLIAESRIIAKLNFQVMVWVNRKGQLNARDGQARRT